MRTTNNFHNDNEQQLSHLTVTRVKGASGLRLSLPVAEEGLHGFRQRMLIIQMIHSITCITDFAQATTPAFLVRTSAQRLDFLGTLKVEMNI